MNLYHERASLFAQLRAVLDAAEAEKRSLTAEEAQECDRFEARINEIDADIERRNRVDGLKPNPVLDIDLNREPEAPTGTEARGVASPEYAAAFRAHVLGEATAEHRAALAVGTIGSTNTGGIIVPVDMQTSLIRAARDFGVVRSLATVIHTEAGNPMEFPAGSTNVAAGWVAEAQAIGESEPTFAKVTLNAYKGAVYAKASWEVLSDVAIDLNSYLGEQFGEAKAVLENAAYVTGDGTAKPAGILDDTLGLASGQIVVGATAATAVILSDDLLDLYHGVKAAYRRNGTFVMNDSTALAVRKLKNDTTGDYLWQPGLQAGQPDLLLGRPVLTDPDMAAIDNDALSVMFGDFKRGYLIRDAGPYSVQVLNELYAINGQVGFVVHFRQDGRLTDGTALAAFQHGPAS